MTAVQNTPSVYFHFDDSAQKTDFSEVPFELSCTHERKNQPPVSPSSPLPLDLTSQFVPRLVGEVEALQTELFFEEFESNFVVVFEDEDKDTNDEGRAEVSMQNAEFDISMSSVRLQQPQRPHIQTVRHSFPPISIPDLSLHTSRQQLNTMKSQFINNPQKDSPSLPAFHIKKRTVFKNKRNLPSQPSSFKITSRKFIPQHSIEVQPRLPSTCRHYQDDHQQYFTSKATPQDSEIAKRLHDKFTQNHSDVVQRPSLKQCRRLVSLERSRRVMAQRDLKIGDDKTVRKGNITIKFPSLR